MISGTSELVLTKREDDENNDGIVSIEIDAPHRDHISV